MTTSQDDTSQDNTSRDDVLDAYESAKYKLSAELRGLEYDATAVALGIALLQRLYFEAPAGDPDEHRAGDRIAARVRERFAMQCVNRGLTGLPGQSEEWYADAETEAKATLAELAETRERTAALKRRRRTARGTPAVADAPAAPGAPQPPGPGTKFLQARAKQGKRADSPA